MGYEEFMRYAGAIALILSIVNVAWTLAGRAGKPVNDKITAVDAKVVAVEAKVEAYRAAQVTHDRRIQAVEGELKHMPTRNEVTELMLATTALRGNVDRLDEAIVGLTHTVRRMDDYLREERS